MWAYARGIGVGRRFYLPVFRPNGLIHMLGNAPLLLISPKQREKMREGRCNLSNLIIEVDVFMVLIMDAFVITLFKVRR